MKTSGPIGLNQNSDTNKKNICECSRVIINVTSRYKLLLEELAFDECDFLLKISIMIL